MPTSKHRTQPLTTDELFDRALAIADSEGLEALTMRRLAAEVGVEAASLYHHLPNKDALLDGVVIRMRSEIRIPSPVPTDWKELMLQIFAEYRRVIAAHPNLTPLAGRRVETDPADGGGLVFLTTLGFTNDDAVELWQSLIAFVVGFSVFSSAYIESDTSDLPSSLATRMTDWRDETCIRTLRAIIDTYDAHKEHRDPEPPTPS
ncbi:MAG: TetR/AcrR family transcriptional regulator [Actinobacteria bacterium]|mgnify:CR=1 FL=1|nr:TetR/AcrR family transcriptional regulator [Actinomycetota bacterium]